MTKLILVGGFLGSGKTTLLAETAGKLASQGKKVGLITNDQAPGLVDTRLLNRSGNGVAEVSGSCFCCNFNGFVDAVRSLVERGAETILAEPVGSCTDLSATIINPLRKFHPEWDLAPLTVLVDPKRFLEALGESPSKADPDAIYIMKLQMDEADRILVNKSDMLSGLERTKIESLLPERYPERKTGLIAAKTGEGVEAWLKEIYCDKNAGMNIVEVDYDRYAHGEAVLGWLNATAKIKSRNSDVHARDVLESLMKKFKTKIQAVDAEIGHVKAILNLDGKEHVANLTRLDGPIDVRETEPQSSEPILIFNARVQMPPESLEKIVRETFESLAMERVDISLETFRCLMPGRPNPTHRFAETVS